MRIHQIKITDRSTFISYEETSTNGRVLDAKVNEPEPPPQGLIDALQAFGPFSQELLDLPTDWLKNIKVTGLSIDTNAETGLRGLIVTFRRSIEKANGRPVIVNTPRMPERGENTSEAYKTLVDADLELLDTAVKLAIEFLNTERGQTEMPFEDEKADHPQESKRSRGRKRRGSNDAPPGDIWNPEKTEPPTDDVLRTMLLDAGRDVPMDIIQAWGSTERDSALRWAGATAAWKKGEVTKKAIPDEPLHVFQHATPELSDGWTDPNPPRLDSDGEQEIKAAAEEGAEPEQQLADDAIEEEPTSAEG